MDNNPAMIPKPTLKLLRSLQQKKFRDQHGLFVVEGEKMVLELIDAGERMETKILIATAEWLKEHGNSFGTGIRVIESSMHDISKGSHLVTPQPVLALVKIPDEKDPSPVQGSGMALGFEAIRDPGNLGTVIRTADWFGIGEIVCSKDSVDQYNPKVVQATMGSLFRVRVRYVDLKQQLESWSGLGKPVYGTFLEGENIYEIPIEQSPLVLFGNESKGLSSELTPYVRRKITVPSFGSSKAESLNLASSVAVICAEIRRRGSMPLIQSGN
jgi:TrmH family RNA methyltransferase